MSINTTIGISPALLQAITQTVTTSKENITISDSPTIFYKDGNTILIIPKSMQICSSNFPPKIETQQYSEKQELEDLSEENFIGEALNEIDQRCPICNDHISGFHYGIYSCESCKGFFKRTVQNKKIYHCRQDGNCKISIESRKRCPACRFDRCCQLGMKIEAIRMDRTRGGRTTYGTTIELSDLTTSKRKYVSNTFCIPPVLETLVSSQCAPDEETCCETGSCDVPTDLVHLLLHKADHCLYQIVRWSRNQPEFLLIDTEEQISLLRNSWAEMLVLNCCWKSMHSKDALRINSSKCISLADVGGTELEPLTRQMLGLSAAYSELKMDAYELAALKSILLLSPDINSLKNLSLIQSAQDKYLEALSLYISSKRPCSIKNKLVRLLSKMAELARISFHVKEFLVRSHINQVISSQSLISELLKEDSF